MNAIRNGSNALWDAYAKACNRIEPYWRGPAIAAATGLVIAAMLVSAYR